MVGCEGRWRWCTGDGGWLEWLVMVGFKGGW